MLGHLHWNLVAAATETVLFAGKQVAAVHSVAERR